MQYFVQQDFHSKPAFSGFLPGIAGVHGIPLWVFYVNRGQGIAGFGVESKDGCISEYHSAKMAYHTVREQGFRSFIRVNADNPSLYEPFAQGNSSVQNEFRVGIDELALMEENHELGLRFEVLYRTLGEAPLAGLVREVKVTNIGKQKLSCELLDGLPQIVPAGVNFSALKEISTTAQAWMNVFPVDGLCALYRVGASMQDTANVQVQKMSNFAMGLQKTADGFKVLEPVFDPDILFPAQQFMSVPEHFEKSGVKGLAYNRQIKEGKQHCAFFCDTISLAPGESYELVELYGGGAEEKQIVDFLGWFRTNTNYASLVKAGKSITDSIVRNSYTHTSNPVFNAYCEQNYLDNVLRGGFPHIEKSSQGGTYIPVFSRKHGDLERDYNWFVIPPEYYSQGWGNYRDVNQNRRADIFFVPESGKEILKEFVSLIQTDAYNPLVVQGRTYFLTDKAASAFNWNELPKASKYAGGEKFSPGALYAAILEDIGPDNAKETSEKFAEILQAADVKYNAVHGEGFWIDHWTYNNDLLENYQAVYPELIDDLFWDSREYPYYFSGHKVLPRKKKWQLTDAGVRQYEAVEEPDVKPESSWMKDRSGNIYLASLGEKLLGMAALKFLGRDPFGIGVEMEAGKPGWYDALNGLPGILGSSLPESWELLRLIRILLTHAVKPESQVKAELAEEIYELYSRIQEFLQLDIFDNKDLHVRWDLMASCREEYREKTASGFSGERKAMNITRLRALLEDMEQDVLAGLNRAVELNDGTLPCYLTIQPRNPKEIKYLFLDTAEAFVPDFDFKALPLFLEGFVRALALQPDLESKKALHEKVMNSELYDRKLSMLRVNAPLDELSHEIGRARAFTPGWLENGSIWMHMQYKYLLALLHAGLYKEFWQLSRTMLVPFMDQEVYGRSPYENSSFIVSSLHPDENLHGRGFVARLSGSTAEFISILNICLWGKQPFRYNEGQLELLFEPCLPEDLFDDKQIITAMFMGNTLVTYQHKHGGDVFPGGNIGIGAINLRMRDDNTSIDVEGPVIPAPYAAAIREGRVSEVRIELERIGG
ncbi:hypothetical protein [Spirochaeta dissipatitropha]